MHQSKPPGILDIVGRLADIAGVLAFGYVLVDWAEKGFHLSEIDLISLTTMIGLVALLYLGARLVREARRFFLRDGGHERPFSERRYREHMRHRHRFFDVRGLNTQGIYTLELEQVFVELTIAPRPAHEASTDPIHALPEGAQRGQTIWSYLDLEQLAHQNLVIIGPPGCGKTTLLKHVALTLTTGRKHRSQWKAPNKMPILLFLRDHAQAIQDNPNLSLAEAVCSALAGWNLHASPSWFESRLASGRCLVMLDGVDEVADPDARGQVVAWVQRQMEACGGNRFIVTSRPYGYHDYRLSGVTVLQVSPFSREQVERFVHNWYAANEILSAQQDDLGVRQDAAKGAADLLQRLRNTQDLADLAVNPLLLTMIATVHRYRPSLPGRRVELYREICDVFLGQRRQARGMVLDLTPAQKQQVLQPLAYYLMCQKEHEVALEEAVAVIADALACVSPTIEGKAFLKAVEDESGLLLEGKSGVYGFAHKTFQEYLASAHALNQGLGPELAGRVGEDWWHETIRLYAAQADASPLIAACLASDPPAIPALILAIECREEALKLEPALRAQLERVLTEGIEDPHPERRRIIAEALLALRLRRMIRLDEDRYLDSTQIIHAEYQLFLDEKRARGEAYQPDHWQGHEFPPGQGRNPIVGVRPSDSVAFCEWWTGRDAREWCYRLPYSGESQVSAMEEMEGPAHWVRTNEGFECSRQDDVPFFAQEQLRQQLIAILADNIDRDLAHGRDPALDLDKDLAFSIAYTRDLALDLDRDRDFVHDLVLALERALTRTRDRALGVNLALDRDLVHDLDLALALAHDLSCNYYSLNTYSHDFDRDKAIGITLDIVLARVLDLNRDLTVGLARVLDRTLVFARQGEPGVDTRQQVRSITLLLATSLLRYLAAQAKLSRLRVLPGRALRVDKSEIRRIANGYLELYVDFCILEARIEGNLPAFEGIRVVREQRSRQ